MQLDLNPGKVTYTEMWGWLKQAHELVWRKPFSFTLGLFISVLPGIFLWFFSEVFEFIPIPDVMSFIFFIPSFCFGFLMLSISPVGIVMSMIAEKADNNEKINWLTEIFLIYLTSFRLYVRCIGGIIESLIKPLFGVLLFIAVVFGFIFLIDSVFGLSSSAGLLHSDMDQGQAIADLPLPEPIFWIDVFSKTSLLYTVNALLVLTACPYFYGLLIYRAVINSEQSHCFLMKNMILIEFEWFVPYLIYFILIKFFISFPVWHIAGWIGVVGGLLSTIYFWAFGYIAARNRFFGGKKNHVQESSQSSSVVQSIRN